MIMLNLFCQGIIHNYKTKHYVNVYISFVIFMFYFRFYLNIKPSRNVTMSLHANLIDGTITRKKKHLGSWGHFITETTNALMPPGSVFTLTVEFTSESELKVSY